MTDLRRSSASALLAATLALLVLAPVAGAKIWFGDQSKRTFSWGERVSMTIAGCPANASCGEMVDGKEVYLVRGRARPGPPKANVYPVGRIGRSGRLVFRMPAVRAGSYHLVAAMGSDFASTTVPVTNTFRVAGTGRAALGCTNRSTAGFPNAFTDRRNVVVGPLVLVGAAFTGAATVRRFGGDKFPALVAAGHRVRIEVPRAEQAGSRLAYGSFYGDGHWTLREAYKAITFTACPRGTRDSTAGKRQVTFWSGFVMTDAPRCLPLDVWVDRERKPRRIVLRLGVRNCG